MEQEDLVTRTVSTLTDKGWQGPALVGLEILRPFSFIGGQILWVLQPILGIFTSSELIGQAALLLEEPEAVDQLIAQLDKADRAASDS